MPSKILGLLLITLLYLFSLKVAAFDAPCPSLSAFLKVRCWPQDFGNFTFFKDFPEYDIEKILPVMNDNLKRLFRMEDLEYRYAPERGIGLYSLKNIEKGTEIFNLIYTMFITSDGLSIEDLFPASHKEKVKDLKPPSFNHTQGVKLLKPHEFRMIFFLSYVLYNVKDFLWKDELLGLSRELRSPTFTMDSEELNFLGNTGALRVLERREVVRDSYLYFLEELNQHVPLETRVNLFGIGTIPVGDFVYIAEMISTRAQTFYRKSKNKTISALIPIHHFINNFDEIPLLNRSEVSVSVKEVRTGITYHAVEDLVPGQEVLHLYAHVDSLELFIKMGFVPRSNPADWLPIKLELENEHFKRIPLLPKIIGLNPSLMWRVIGVGNLIYMDNENLNQCLKNVNSRTEITDPLEFVLKFCQTPKWESEEIFEGLKTNVLIEQIELKGKAKRLTDLIDRLENTRKKKPRKIRIKNLKGILKLTKARLKIAEFLLKEDKFAKHFYIGTEQKKEEL